MRTEPGTVAHFKLGAYLPLTENWIHGQLSNLRRWKPVVYCSSRENADAFPAPVVREFDWGGRRPWALINRVGERLTGVAPAMAAAVLRDRPRLVHAHFGPSGHAALGLSRRFSLPLVTTFYGYDLTRLPEQKPEWRERYAELFARGSLFLVEGRHMRKRLVALGCPAEKAAVQHIGVDLDALPYRPREAAPGTLKVLIAAGFTEKKGIPYAFEALGLVRRSRPDLALSVTVIGDSRGSPAEEEEKRKIHAALDASGLKDRTTFLGLLSHARLREAFYAHDLFLSPSVTAKDGDTEGGAPVGIIEAAASGLPVVSTTHCDIPEVLGPAGEGCLAPERDAAALARVIEALAADPSRRRALAEAGRRHVEAEYDVRTLGPRLEEHYDGLVKTDA